MPPNCSICQDFSNPDSHAHRMSKRHQKKLSQKLRQISFHVSQKKGTVGKIHDAEWGYKDRQRFCHFCGHRYIEHKEEDGFTIESLGSLCHHASMKHAECVQNFLKLHGRAEKCEKFCVTEEELNSLRKSIQEAKEKYLKKMEILHHQSVKQIKEAEEERLEIYKEAMQLCSTTGTEHQMDQDQNLIGECNRTCFKDKSSKPGESGKVPPWLMKEESSEDSFNLQASAPLIGPTADTFLKHVASQKKKGLSAGRIGANFKRIHKTSKTWLPSYQGIWNKGSRKKIRIQFFKRKH